MRSYMIILALIVLTSIHGFYVAERRSLVDSAHHALVDGSYTSTLHIMSDDEEYIGEENIMLSVNRGGFSLHLQRVYNQCVHSNLYATGTVHRHEKGILMEFTKVLNERLDVSCAPGSTVTMPTVYGKDPQLNIQTLYRLTYQNERVYCFESDSFGSICLNKE
ncbi:hypothetical protein [Vibrio sp. SBT000027]|uniref:hypothetical protein n=1 Tax=Vibrio sp. SBT000027 TaxID=1803384 RepID=UPI000EF51C28|nr:hypothetical protein [Vibrio sp. SBT000027]